MSSRTEHIESAKVKLQTLGVRYSTNIKHRSNKEAKSFVNSKKEFYTELKSRLRCETCGNPEITFHHLDRATKVIGVSDMVNTRWHFTIDDILAEVSKCIPLCKECHKSLEAGL